MNDQPSSYFDVAESLSPDWALVVFALVIVAVGTWLVFRYADK
jgi:hypothetical protein